MPLDGLQYVSVVLPDHSHLLFDQNLTKRRFMSNVTIVLETIIIHLNEVQITISELFYPNKQCRTRRVPRLWHLPYTRDGPKVWIVILSLCPETFLRDIPCTIQTNKRYPL